MEKLHRLLDRQIRRHLPGGEVRDDLLPFLEAVNSAYFQFDDDRGMLERSLEVSSQELMEVNSELLELTRDLEKRVAKRTEDLTRVNQRLVREIEERIEAENRLRRSEEKYRSIFNNAVEGIFQISSRGVFINANPAMAEILGYDSPDDLLSTVRNVRTDVFAYPHQRDDLIRQLNERGWISGFEAQIRLKDGNIIWCELSVRNVLDDHGRQVMEEGMLLDITGRKLFEESLTRAREEAEAASRLKSDFLSTVSHELRTPLTSMLGFAKMVRKRLRSGPLADLKKHDTDVEKYLEHILGNIEIIVAEGELLTELISNVLDLARLESGQFEWRMEKTSMEEIVKTAVSSMQAVFSARGLNLVQDVEPDLPLINMDAARIVQVLKNLLSNAAKFSSDGNVVCKVRRSDGMVEVSVRDQGLGISEKDIKTVFDRFRQVGDILTGKPKGTGLGLPICKEIIEHHGGRIWVKSQPGKGSTFYFSVPIVSFNSQAPLEFSDTPEQCRK